MCSVRPSGAKSYVAVARSPAGKQVWTSIGRVDLLTIEQAREQARDAIKLTLAGMSPDLARSAAGSLEMRIAAKAAAFIANGIEPACYLYRHYNPRGDLIYCGVTLSPLRRNEQTRDRRDVATHDLQNLDRTVHEPRRGAGS